MTLNRKAPIALLVAFTLFPACFAAAQPDPIIRELNFYWDELSGAVMTGDINRLKSLYHEDAISNGWDENSPNIELLSHDKDAEFHAGTKNGLRVLTLDWRFSSRMHDGNVAYEVGIGRFQETPAGGQTQISYAHVEQNLVKKGRWLTIVEKVHWDATEAEWNALKDRR